VDAETKGDRAAQILETEVYQEAVMGAKQRITMEWAQAEDPALREDLWHKLQAIDGVTTELKIIRDRGIVARQKREKGDVDRA
jgi:hypothetical protein